MIKVLIACEESQIITLEMRKIGIEAYSCDIGPCTGGHSEWHIHGDALIEAYSEKYEMMIAHPPCTYLTVTGNKWMKPKFKMRFPNRVQLRLDAIDFFMQLYNAPIKMIAIENPVGIMSTVFRKPDQYVHPYYFGDKHKKKTGFWLKGLPLLQKTKIVKPQIYTDSNGKKSPMWHVSTMNIKPSLERTRIRSKTFPGIAKAIAYQWGMKIYKITETIK